LRKNRGEGGPITADSAHSEAAAARRATNYQELTSAPDSCTDTAASSALHGAGPEASPSDSGTSAPPDAADPPEAPQAAAVIRARRRAGSETSAPSTRCGSECAAAAPDSWRSAATAGCASSPASAAATP